LNWLPADTQTLIVASKPFVIPVPQKDDDDDAPFIVSDGLREYSLGRLSDFEVIYQPLIGRTVQFAVAGVRDFRLASGLGLMPYDGCAVIAFSQPLAATFESALGGVPSENYSGVTVFTFTQVRSGSVRSRPEMQDLLVAQLSPNLLVVGTDRSSMRTLLEHRERGAMDGPFPSHLPEWKLVDAKAPVFALRHYRRAYDPEKRTTVVSLSPADGEFEPDDSGIGFVYNAQSSSTSQSVLYLSGNSRAIEIARKRWEWEDEGLPAPTVTRVSSGVFRVITHPRQSLEHDGLGTFALLLLAALGFTIAL